MAGLASSWQGNRWAALAGVTVTLGVIALVVWMSYTMYFAAVERLERETPIGGGEDGDTGDRGAGGRNILNRLHAAKRAQELQDDARVERFAQAVAYAWSREQRLPGTREAVEAAAAAAGWSRPPARTERGEAFGYSPGEGRAWAIVLAGEDGKLGTDDDQAVPMEVPADIPAGASPDGFLRWWRESAALRVLDQNRRTLEGILPGKGLPRTPSPGAGG
jgi:hypothetical protein